MRAVDGKQEINLEWPWGVQYIHSVYLCILMEGLVRDDHVGYNRGRTNLIGSQSHHDNDLQPPGFLLWSEVKCS